VQGTCVLDTGGRGARLLVWLILNDRAQPSFIAGVLAWCGVEGRLRGGVGVPWLHPLRRLETCEAPPPCKLTFLSLNSQKLTFLSLGPGIPSANAVVRAAT
jgi:hypothetical protein